MLAFRYGKHEAAGCIQAIIVILIQFKHPDSVRHSEKTVEVEEEAGSKTTQQPRYFNH